MTGAALDHDAKVAFRQPAGPQQPGHPADAGDRFQVRRAGVSAFAARLIGADPEVHARGGELLQHLRGHTAP